LSTLTPVALADFSTVRNWSEFAACLNQIHQQSGLSLNDLERAGRSRAQSDDQFRELKRSTVSDALNGKRPINKALLRSLLAVWDLPTVEDRQVRDAWQRLSVGLGRGPANARRFEEASPRELGIHAAITTPDWTDELPSYVRRDFDDQLHDMLASGATHGCFVVLVGGSSAGKTRSLYEAILDTVPNWWVVQPAETREILGLLDSPAEKTILWLDDLHRFLGADPPLTKAVVLTLVRAGAIVVGTLWPDEYAARKAPRRSGNADKHADDRMLLEFARVIGVADVLSPKEQDRAEEIAATDGRIRIALDTKDAGLTQVLAAGPDIVHHWELAPNPYTKAIITAAADARRLGVHGPLSRDLLGKAMAGYLTDTQRVMAPASWLDAAVPHATMPLHGAVAALAPVAGREAGTLAGYVAADYLAQHVRRTRRTDCPPASTWEALIADVVKPDDLWRLAASAKARMRYRYAEQSLRRLTDLNSSATAELAALLVRQDRFAEALAVLGRRLSVAPDDPTCVSLMAKVNALRARADRLRPLAADDPTARDRLATLLVDGGRSEDLRTRADAGDAVAAELLAEMLAERGCLRELREWADAGHQFAAERLADLLVTLRRTAELQDRAEVGDRAAALRLSRLSAGAEPEADDDPDQLAKLRLDADAGAEHAASRLTALLFDRRREVELRAEVNAGTYQAAERLLALLNAEEAVDQRDVARLGAFGLHANGSAVTPGGDDDLG
jgi:hypothetical protein